MLPHIHTLFWFIMIILYVVALLRFRSTSKPPKVLHNLLRFSFLLTAFFGFYSIILNELSGFYHIKGTIAIVMFGLMEMSLARLYKNKNASVFIGLVAALLVIIILMGYRIISF
jgi:hypothetical protein